MRDQPLAGAFVGYAIQKLGDHLAQIRRCTSLMSSEEIWYRPNESSNSVGNLLLHLRGNITQWIVCGIGGRPGQRDRQAEFDRREPIPTDTLVRDLQGGVDDVIEVLRGVSVATLTAEFVIQDYTVTGVAAITHVVEHFAFHTGQIVTTTKWLLDVDLSLYDAHGHRRDGRDSGMP